MVEAELGGDATANLLVASPVENRLESFDLVAGENWHLREIVSIPRPVAVEAADLNSDDLVDVVAVYHQQSNSSTIGWFLNLGNRRFAKEPILVGQVDSRYAADEIELIDRDNDGDLDVKYGTDWFANRGNSIDFDRRDALPGVTVADLDGDGDFDVVGELDTRREENEIVWYENHGDFTFVNPVVLGSTRVIRGIGASFLLTTADDVDGDGDFDVLLFNYYQSDIGTRAAQIPIWFEICF